MCIPILRYINCSSTFSFRLFFCCCSHSFHSNVRAFRFRFSVVFFPLRRSSSVIQNLFLFVSYFCFSAPLLFRYNVSLCSARFGFIFVAFVFFCLVLRFWESINLNVPKIRNICFVFEPPKKKICYCSQTRLSLSLCISICSIYSFLVRPISLTNHEFDSVLHTSLFPNFTVLQLFLTFSCLLGL